MFFVSLLHVFLLVCVSASGLHLLCRVCFLLLSLCVLQGAFLVFLLELPYSCVFAMAASSPLLVRLSAATRKMFPFKATNVM